MPTEETIKTTFVEALKVHFVVSRPDPDQFLADVVTTLFDLGFSTSVLKRAARNFIRTRRSPNFSPVADCIVACKAAQIELRAGIGSTPSESGSGNPLNADRSAIDSNDGSEATA